MIAEALPNKLKKRRVLYFEDFYWEHITQLAKEHNISCSAALRLILKNGSKTIHK